MTSIVEQTNARMARAVTASIRPKAFLQFEADNRFLLE
jgi:hypothetical protein